MNRLGHRVYLVLLLALLGAGCAVDPADVTSSRVDSSAAASSAAASGADDPGDAASTAVPVVTPASSDVAALPTPTTIANPTPVATPVPAATPDGKNEAEAWDYMMIDRFEAAGGSVVRPVGEFAVAAAGYCLGVVTDEQTEWMFPTNPDLGAAVRELSDDDCALRVDTIFGNEATRAATWQDMLAVRFVRIVPFEPGYSLDDFARHALIRCGPLGSVDEELAVLSASTDLELAGIFYNDECQLHDGLNDSAGEVATEQTADTLFLRTGPNGKAISTMNLGTGDVTTVVRDAGQQRRGDSAVSPDGAKIAFIRDVTLVAVGADGAAEVELSFGGIAARPTWSPDGQSIVYRLNVGDARTISTTVGAIQSGQGPCTSQTEQLMITTPDHSRYGPVTDPEARASLSGGSSVGADSVVWRTDGRITFFEHEDCSSNRHLFAVDPGTGQRQIVLTLPEDAQPFFSVSPVDNRLAIAGIDTVPKPETDEDGRLGRSLHDQRVRLFVQSEDNNMLRPVAGITDPVIDVNWSPDGEWIAFATVLEQDGNSSARRRRGLFVVSADGTDLRQLSPATEEGFQTMSYRWSPTSDELAVSYGVLRQREDELAIIDLQGTSRVIGTGTVFGWR